MADALASFLEQAVKDARPILREGKKLAKKAAKGPSDEEPAKKKHRLRNVVLLAAAAGAAAVGYRKTQA